MFISIRKEFSIAYFFPFPRLETALFISSDFCILMADACGLDLDMILQEKIKLNNKKYPVEKAYGSKEKYNRLDWSGI